MTAPKGGPRRAAGLHGQAELLAADVHLPVGDEPGQRLEQGLQRAEPRRIPEYLPGAVDARGDAAESVLAGGLGVLGPGLPAELGPADELQYRLPAEPVRDAGRQAAQRHRLRGYHVE